MFDSLKKRRWQAILQVYRAMGKIEKAGGIVTKQNGGGGDLCHWDLKVESFCGPTFLSGKGEKGDLKN